MQSSEREEEGEGGRETKTKKSVWDEDEKDRKKSALYIHTFFRDSWGTRWFLSRGDVNSALQFALVCCAPCRDEPR